jgi:hypothetical protein
MQLQGSVRDMEQGVPLEDVDARPPDPPAEPVGMHLSLSLYYFYIAPNLSYHIPHFFFSRDTKALKWIFKGALRSFTKQRKSCVKLSMRVMQERPSKDLILPIF